MSLMLQRHAASDHAGFQLMMGALSFSLNRHALVSAFRRRPENICLF
jgi:hypothetical protein